MSRVKGNRIFIYGIFCAVFFVVFITFYSTFSLVDNDLEFESLIYDIGEEYIEDISVNTDVSLFFKYFDIKNGHIEVVDSDGEVLESGYVSNGSKTNLYNNSNELVKSYINVIKGDFDNDGDVDDNDFKGFSGCLVNNCSLEGYQVASLDIDEDGSVHINDLLLLDKAVTFGYSGIILDKESIVLQSNEKERLVASVEPSYGVNQNVKWISLDENVATVDESGVVVGHNEGNTEIQAMTLDGKYVASSLVKVDNTIQLESYEGVGYVGGENLRIKIKLIDYDGVSCKVNNQDIAECNIDGEYLVLKALGQGISDVVVTSENYGEAVYKLTTYSVYLNVMPKYFCTTPNNIYYITVSSFHGGTLSFNSFDSDIVKRAYMSEINGRKMLRIELGSKQGRTTLTVKEGNGNTTNDVIIDVTRVGVSDIGKFTKVGEETSTLIVGDNLGDLSCISEDETKATCRIEENKLIVTPLAVGEVNVRVYNRFIYNGGLYNCGEALFLVVIQE